MKKKKEEKPVWMRIRRSWGQLNPWTKVKPSGKLYNRQRAKEIPNG